MACCFEHMSSLIVLIWKKKNDFFNGISAYFFLVPSYCLNVYSSVILGIKRKPHLLLAWNWCHFVAIMLLHQPHPTDSADINTQLQLNVTNSIPQMHGGFLLICIWFALLELSASISLLPVAPFTNMGWLKSKHGFVITSTLKCGMKLHNHSQTSMVQPLKFGNR